MLRKTTTPLWATVNRSLKDTQWLPFHQLRCKSTTVQQIRRAERAGYGPRSTESRDNSIGSSNNTERSRRTLSPYVLSGRLQRLFKQGKQDDAVSLLKSLPLDAQNTAVWNLVIKELMASKRYRLAYEQYVDMKRRGFTPNLRTYTTFFGGLYRLEEWETYSKLLENVHTLHESYLTYAHAVQHHDPTSREISTAPTAAYLKILASAGLYQQMFDVYYAMEPVGPLAPSPAVYTAMFDGLSFRKPSSIPEETADSRTRNASDVKMLWKQMLKTAELNPSFHIDAHLLANAIKVLATGRTVDHLFAFDIVREYIGLTDHPESPFPPKFGLSRALLAEIMWLCLSAKKYRLCIRFADQVQKRDAEAAEAGGKEAVLDAGHMNSVLKARAALSIAGSQRESQEALLTLQWMTEQALLNPNAHKLRPTMISYSAALSACWRTGNWLSATKIFQMMTGWDAKDFTDSRYDETVPPERERLRLLPDSDTMSSFVRTAVHSRQLANMRQCLRIVNYVGLHLFLQAEPRRFVHNSPFFIKKFAEAMLDLFAHVIPAEPLGKQRSRWLKTKAEIETVLNQINNGKHQSLQMTERSHSPRFKDLVLEAQPEDVEDA